MSKVKVKLTNVNAEKFTLKKKTSRDLLARTCPGEFES